MAELQVTLDAPLPRTVAVGAGSAIFVCGWAHRPGTRIHHLSLSVDGAPVALMHHSMPRLDPLRETGDPAAYRSGFWGIVPLAPIAAPREVRIALVGETVDGAPVHGHVGTVQLTPDHAPSPLSPTPTPGAPGPLVAVAMATYNAPEALFRAQIESIREQSHTNWVCVISDDRSDPAARARMDAIIGDDPRFAISQSPGRLGFAANFERALGLVPPEAAFIALADQDDRWYPHKLERLLAAIGDAPLAYSDQAIVTRHGERIADSYWTTRTNNHQDLLSLLSANAVTGAASLIRADLLRDALPFPPAQFAHYHDHWIALVARCRGEIRFVAEALYDYVQHGDASLGHTRATQMPSLGSRLAGLRTRGPRERIRKWRLHYFVDLARLLVVATILEARLGPRMAPADRRTLARFLTADRSTTEPLRLLARGLWELLGPGRPETLGAEWTLFLALFWRRLVSLSAREAPGHVGRLDALPPTDLAPGTRPGAGARPASAAQAIAAKIAPLDLRIDPDAPARINLLIPSIDLDHFFGGYIAKFNLALALGRRGHRVRIVCVDDAPAPPRDWQRRISSFSGLSGVFDHVEVHDARAEGLTVSPADRLIATTWWTAHIAEPIRAALGLEHFLYLIQEYEPFTFPMGSHAALARASYDLPHAALFSTALLEDYFRAHRIGIHRDGAPLGHRLGRSFDNAITPVPAPTAAALAARRPRRLLFYGRPERHAARNLFELGVLALERAVAAGVFVDGWELRGIGSVGGGAELSLGHGATLTLARRGSQADYAALLGEHDLGLALMYTPHPSLVPLEMASAGLLTVTNTFENKTAAALGALSANLIAAPPTVEGVAAALTDAAARIEDVDARAAGAAQMRWPRSWEAAFDPEVLDFVEAALGLTG